MRKEQKKSFEIVNDFCSGFDLKIQKDFTVG